MKKVDDFRLRFGKQELVPIVTGGMGVDISTAELALEAARLGGVGHISDAMVPTVSDRRFDTGFVAEKLKLYKYNVASSDKSPVQFNLGRLAEATQVAYRPHHGGQEGSGPYFHQLHGKGHHGHAARYLARAASSALDAGIDGITSAPACTSVRCADPGSPRAFATPGFGDHRFVAARVAVVPAQERGDSTVCRTMSSWRARLPADTLVSVWTGRSTTSRPLSPRFTSIRHRRFDYSADPPRAVFSPAARPVVISRSRRGGGAAGNALHRDHGCGLPAEVKQKYFKANGGGHRGQHDLAHGLSDAHAEKEPGYRRWHPSELRGLWLPCSMAQAAAPTSTPTTARWRRIRRRRRFPVKDKTCLCTQLRNFDIWTCGHYAYRLKGHQLAPAGRQLWAAQRRARIPRLSVQHRAPRHTAGTNSLSSPD